jgi:hypothetical protein
MRPLGTDTLAGQRRQELLQRNGVFETFFKSEASRLAEACDEMSRRFLVGGFWCSGTPRPLLSTYERARSKLSPFGITQVIL